MKFSISKNTMTQIIAKNECNKNYPTKNVPHGDKSSNQLVDFMFAWKQMIKLKNFWLVFVKIEYILIPAIR